MSKFKVGDKVMCVEGTGTSEVEFGMTFIVSSSEPLYVAGIRPGYRLSDDWFELIKNNNTNMLEKFKITFTSEPFKTFRKVGITNGDDLLTEDGTKLFLGWMLKKHGEEFKKEVADLLVEDNNK